MEELPLQENIVKHEITLEEFIKNYVRIAPEGKPIELTPAQRAFIDWLEENKKKGLNIKVI